MTCFFATSHPRPAAKLAARQALVAALCMTTLGLSQAQAPAADTRPVQKMERITHEDSGSRVDEIRVGGQTRQIDVTTKTGVPAYQVAPPDATQGPSAPAGERSGNTGNAGRSSWRIFSF